MSRSKTSKRQIEAAQLQKRVLAERVRGRSYREIADKLGCEPSTAYRAVKRAIKEIREKVAEDATEVLALELERLDAMLLGLWPQASKGKVGAVDRVIKIMERRARLLGLDAAQRVEHSGPDGGPIQTEERLNNEHMNPPDAVAAAILDIMHEVGGLQTFLGQRAADEAKEKADG